VEFTILAIPFSLLVFAIFESCISFGAQQLLTNATDDVARELRTGQIKRADVLADKSLIRDRICDKISLLVGDDCPGLVVDLRSFNTYQEAAGVRIKLTADGDLDTSDFGMDPGPALSKNMLRVFYRWPVITDFMRKSMSNLKGGKTLLFATATWKNEPFND
jgi:Flp pilus assembly protein TadG